MASAVDHIDVQDSFARASHKWIARSERETNRTSPDGSSRPALTQFDGQFIDDNLATSHGRCDGRTLTRQNEERAHDAGSRQEAGKYLRKKDLVTSKLSRDVSSSCVVFVSDSSSGALATAYPVPTLHPLRSRRMLCNKSMTY